MDIKTWISVLTGSSKPFRKNIRKAVMEGVRQFDATWTKVSDEEFDKYATKTAKSLGISKELFYSLVGDHRQIISRHNPNVEKFAKWVDSEKDKDYVGTCKDITYIKPNGDEDQLSSLWGHEFGSAMNLYVHKKLPMIIVTGPNIKFNDSVAHGLNPRGTIEKGLGIMD